MRVVIGMLAGLFVAAPALAEIKTETIGYTHDGTELEGCLAYDDNVDGPRPGVLVIHEWWGQNDYARTRVRELAKMGYAAFALDMYGKGKVTDAADQASVWATPFYQDRGLARERAKAGLEVLRSHERCDGAKIAVIGYCFGGAMSLELARSGAPLKGAASFHGNLKAADPADNYNIVAKLLVLHGGADPMVTMEEAASFSENLEKAGKDYEIIVYGGAVHSFTNPKAGQAGIEGVAYDEKADRKSWAALSRFLREIFGEDE